MAKKKAKARVPGTKSASVFPLPDPRAMEGMLAAIGRGAAHYAADEALFQAQDLMYEAFEAQGVRRAALARGARDLARLRRCLPAARGGDGVESRAGARAARAGRRSGRAGARA